MTLRVKLEVVRFGDETDVREIGRLDISNLGHVTPDKCEYEVIEAKGRPGLYNMAVLHDRDDGAWKLVAKVIKELNIRGP